MFIIKKENKISNSLKNVINKNIFHIMYVKLEMIDIYYVKEKQNIYVYVIISNILNYYLIYQ